jgi:hypothetical protein
MTFVFKRPALLVAFLAASTSGLAILLYAAGWMTMTYSVTILAPLTALTFVGLFVNARGAWEDVFLQRITGGLIAGLAGLVAYDMVRYLILLSRLASFNPFRPIEVYGLLILDRTQDSALTKAVGWAFHVWNGLSFAVMYTLAVGRGRVLWAIGWGMLLELATIATYPSMFRITLGREFLMMSLTGHFFYGWAVGLATRRAVR